MGKKLIIKGADFSANAINITKWVTDNFTLWRNPSTTARFNQASAKWAFNETENSKLRGKVIRKVRMYARADSPMTVHFYLTNNLGSVGAVKATASIPGEVGWHTVALDTPLLVGDSDYVVFDDAVYAVVSRPDHCTFYRKVGTSSYDLYDDGGSGMCLGIDFAVDDDE